MKERKKERKKGEMGKTSLSPPATPLLDLPTSRSRIASGERWKKTGKDFEKVYAAMQAVS